MALSRTLQNFTGGVMIFIFKPFKAGDVIKRLCDEDSRILNSPEVFIAVAELANSSVNFTVRAWVNAADFWGVYFNMNERVYKQFPKEGLNIPYPQMDVHLHKEQ